MSPPEVWGPAIWRLFHTLIERLNEDVYSYVSPQLFNMIVKICKFLPCPECSNDATNFLAKIKMSDIKTKAEFKNTFYLFHNWVNAKKRKQLFNYSYMSVYRKYKLIDVINNFIANYQTKGNMKLLTESFQRHFVIKDFKQWITRYIRAFIPTVNIPKQLTQSEENIIIQINNNIINEEKPLIEDSVTQDTTLVEPVIEETIITQEPAIELIIEEPVLTEQHIVYESNKEEVIEETIVEQDVI
jgi:hypothetical protein